MWPVGCEQRGASRPLGWPLFRGRAGLWATKASSCPQHPGDLDLGALQTHRLSQVGLTGWVLPSCPQAALGTFSEPAPEPGSGV